MGPGASGLEEKRFEGIGLLPQKPFGRPVFLRLAPPPGWPEGKKILDRLGFKKVGDMGGREDHHSLYQLSLTGKKDIPAYFHDCL
jgi:hypothetical protein